MNNSKDREKSIESGPIDFVHLKYYPFTGAKHPPKQDGESRVYLTHDTFAAGGPISGMFINRKLVNTSSKTRRWLHETLQTLAKLLL